MRFLAFCLFAVLILQVGGAAPAHAFETKAEYAVLMDYESGQVLYEKNSDVLTAPASMSKMMTMVMLFEALKDGAVALGDEFLVSENAWRKGGAKSGSSTMFAEVNSSVPIEALIRGVIVQSGNDASIAIAEGLRGTEEAFADAMTARAREIGMDKAVFANATGWPDPDHMMTAYELALLARYTISEFPDFYPYYAEKSFTWNGITQQNRNPLLYLGVGSDGLKTGHTEASGYGLTASAKRGNRRLILVVNGLSSEKERSNESKRILAWGFREFETYALFKQGQVVEEAEVWEGTYTKVPLVLAEPLSVVLNRDARKKMKVSVVYDGPIQAPVTAGQEVGVVRVEAPGFPGMERPLLAGANVDRLGFFGRAMNGLAYLVLGG